VAALPFFHSICLNQWDGLEASLRNEWPENHRLILRRDYRFSMPAEAVEIPAETAVICVSADPYYWLSRSYRTRDLMKENAARLEEIARFVNPQVPGETTVERGPAIVLYRAK
jgi:hypothetical protein